MIGTGERERNNMMSEESPDLFEVTCLNCNTTKSYFTAQGVAFFKINHEGHKLRVREPKKEEAAAQAAAPKETQAPQAPAAPVEVPSVEVEEPVAAAPIEVEAEPAPVMAAPVPSGNRVKLGNMVVDVVDEEKGRAIKVYGIAGGMERFTKEFGIAELGELNAFLESGLFYDSDNHVNYAWTPDKIDLSTDVVRMLDEGPVAPAGPAPQAAVTVEVPKETVEVTVPVAAQEQAVLAPARVEVEVPKQVMAPLSASEELLLGKLSYVQPGEDYRRECARISKALRKYRWNTEPPYVIGAVFDDLVSIQSQTGMIKASAIRAVEGLGYTFIAIEAPSGTVTAWFRKGAEVEDEPLEFSPSPGR